MEAREGPGKWGSAIDVLGGERVERTEVEGWGYGGRVGEARTSPGNRKGRHRDAKDLTEEDRQEFISTAQKCWMEMEGLRQEWDKRLAALGLPSHKHCDSEPVFA